LTLQLRFALTSRLDFSSASRQLGLLLFGLGKSHLLPFLLLLLFNLALPHLLLQGLKPSRGVCKLVLLLLCNFPVTDLALNNILDL